MCFNTTLVFFQSLFDEYPRFFMVNVDNVGSKQMQQIRGSLRGHGVLIMGKNTTMRKAIRGHLDQNPHLEKILPCIKGNVGFVFTSEDLSDVRDLILANKVGSPSWFWRSAVILCLGGSPCQSWLHCSN